MSHALKSLVQNKATEVKALVAGLSCAVMSMPINSVSCTSQILNGSSNQDVTVNTNLSANVLLNRLFTIIAGAVVVYGLFQLASGVFKFIEAKQESNTTDENKAAKQMAFSFILIAAPAVMIYIFK